MKLKNYCVYVVALTLMACQKQPEQVDAKKVVMCAFNKQSEVCSTLNSTEKKALSCLTDSGEFTKKECDEIKLNSGSIKPPDIRFNLSPSANKSNLKDREYNK